MLSPPSLSIVIPIRDEEPNLVPLMDALMKSLVAVDHEYEIIVVNDYSQDNSVQILKQLALDNPEEIGGGSSLHIVHNNGLPGKDQALQSGYTHAKGDIIVTLDGDLQNDPADIPNLLTQLEKCDMVCGIRVSRKDSFLRRVCSVIANRVRNLITGDSLADAGCALRAFNRKCLSTLQHREIFLYGMTHVFFPTLVRMDGYKVLQIPVNHHPRMNGKAKFQAIRGRLLTGLLACIKVKFQYKKR